MAAGVVGGGWCGSGGEVEGGVLVEEAVGFEDEADVLVTRPVAGHMLANYDGVLKIDGEMGNKKTYDPRVWGASAEAGMAARIVEAAQQLGSVGKSA
ncbi:hypothetical protein AR689_13310 [Arthrobacter sp. EpRS71]|nr:hypothetical protein AR689_13310 [Arthrobacter sp. EpRS71]